MQCEDPSIIRRKKKPPPLKLTSVLKVIRRSIAGPPPPLPSPVKKNASIEITSYSPVMSPRILTESPPEICSTGVLGSSNAASDTTKKGREPPSTVCSLNLLSVSTESFSSRDSNSSLSSYNATSPSSSPLLKEPNNNHAKNIAAPKLFPRLGSLDSKIPVVDVWSSSRDDVNGMHSGEKYLPEVDVSDGRDSPTSSSSESTLTPSFRSFSLSRTNNFSFDDPLKGKEGRGGTYLKNGSKEPKSPSYTYATIRQSKIKKKPVKKDALEAPKPNFNSVEENIHRKEDLTPVGPSRSRRATVGQIYRNERRKMNGWSNMDVLGDGRNVSKADRKNLEKTNKLNIHLIALFNAVEHGQLEKARTILQNNTFDINSVNQDGFNVLEVAVMTGNISIVKTLQNAGAMESGNDSLEQRLKHLDDLLYTSERKRSELAAMMAAGNYSKEKEHLKWERHSKLLKKMKSGLEKLQVPKPPSSATVEVIDGTRVRVNYQESFHQHTTVTTKLKVEWTTDEWKTVARSLELYDLRRMSAVIEGLAQGCRHHFRVCAGNLRGYGPTIPTSPPTAVPSSWRDTDNRKPRLEGLLRELEDLFKQVRNSRPEHASEIRAIEPGQETPIIQRKAQKKKSLMQLFTHAPKFHKSLKRGSYFACIVFCEDKVLVTTEDFPPIVEVDENYLSQAKLHFHWLMKVATTWEDVKSLRQDMEQAGSASHLPYRIKLLQAAANMQSVLGIQDLGQCYHKPIKDSDGTYVFCTVKQVKSTKAISTMNVRWVPLSKLRDRKSSMQGSSPIQAEVPLTAGDILISSLQEQITYSQVSQLPLKRGLYLGYLKLQSSVEQLQVIVPGQIPNMFPHVKIRDNPHVSREEWESVQSLKQNFWSKTDDPGGGTEKESTTPSTRSNPSPAQKVWQKQLVAGIKHLLQDLEVDERWSDHRLFTGEALELNGDVTLLLLLPPIESVCCVPGQEDALLTQSSLIALPLHTFEMVHMGTYQGHLLGRYTRLSYILEMDMLMAKHASREAFSETEITRTKERLWQLGQFQELLDSIWKRFRWVMDVITFARDKATPGLPFTTLCQNIGRQDKIDLCHGNSLGLGKTPNILTDSMNLRTENKRFRYDKRSSFRNRQSNGMLKSNTAENIRNLTSNELKLPKSKTSECVFYSNSCLKCSNFEATCSECIQSNPSGETIPIIKWKAEDACGGTFENKMYSKDNQTTKSDYLLQEYSENIDLPPRKSSAPSSLGGEHLLRPKSSMSDYNINSNPSSISLDTLAKIDDEKDGKSATDLEVMPALPPDKNSPSTSCSDLGQKLSCSGYSSDKRASSSLSHESEASFSSMTASLRSLSSNETETDGASIVSKESAEDRVKRLDEPAIIQVYAAYETGLASGTSVKLHITPRTTAREVIDLVVKQLNMAVVLKNKNGPIYGKENLKNFCLVAVIGARERCLRDDFQPLQLQNPWKKGRLYVRLKHDLLAAIEQSNSRNSSYL